jgi:hypothetical protein
MIDPPVYYASVLQALTHWISYKREYFRNHLLPEGALVAELTQLLSAKVPSEYRVYCETLYNEIDESILENIRADITVYEVVGDFLELRDVIEVKRYESKVDFDKVLKDSKKLSILKAGNPDVRLLQIVAGQKKAPREFLTEAHNAQKKIIFSDNNDFFVKARLSKKAYGTKKSSDSGAFAVLLEVQP